MLIKLTIAGCVLLFLATLYGCLVVAGRADDAAGISDESGEEE